jgi:uracil-DNA glycosylase family 4
MRGILRAKKSSAAALRLSLEVLKQRIIACRNCPRLVEWREQVADEKRAAFRDEVYWGRPVPGFGDPLARLLIVGLAPAAHGGNRTGRVFTGDRSGDFLFAALHRAGYANQVTSTHRGDGLQLTDCYIAACVRCAPPGNKPTPEERDTCLPYLVDEVRLLRNVRAMLCLGSFAWDGALRMLRMLGHVATEKALFGHGSRCEVGPYSLIGCYHPSQQNTFTGRLTPAMLDDVLRKTSRY